MRKLQYRTVTSKKTGVEVNYRDLCLACLEAPSPNGYTIEEMRALLGVIKKFSTGDDVDYVDLSEEDYTILVRQIKIFRWKVMDPLLVVFADYVYNLRETNEKEG